MIGFAAGRFGFGETDVKNPTDWSEGFACGAITVAIIYTIALPFFIYLDRSQLADYATIWVGILALLGAWLTLRGIRDQNQININIFEKTEYQKVAAAKSMLPLLLSEISDTAQHNIQRNFPEDIFPYGTEIQREFKQLDSETIGRIRDYAPLFSQEISKRLSNIISSYQVLKSRDLKRRNTLIDDSAKFSVGENGAIDSAIRWAAIHCMADSLYPFARGATEGQIENITAEDIKGALFSAGIVTVDNEKLEKIINSRAERNDLEFDFEARYKKNTV